MPYRLYIDESGDHNYKKLEDIQHRYLCLMGCIIDYDYNRLHFRSALETLKQRHFPYDPDDGTPPILHRYDLKHQRGIFKCLSDSNSRNRFDDDLLLFLNNQKYTLITVVIDKDRHKTRYGDKAEHPYHRCLEIILERYCGFLKYHNGKGDVMAEARGSVEDNLLKDAYKRFLHQGSKYGSKVTSLSDIRSTLSSGEIKLKPKKANIVGLQIADLLAYPSRQGILFEKNRITSLSKFDLRVWECIQSKFNRNHNTDKINGYGWVFIEP